MDYTSVSHKNVLSTYDGTGKVSFPTVTICPSERSAPSLVRFRQWIHFQVHSNIRNGCLKINLLKMIDECSNDLTCDMDEIFAMMGGEDWVREKIEDWMVIKK